MDGLLKVNLDDYAGVVVVPQDLTTQVLELAEEWFASESQSRAAMATGRDPFDVYKEFGRF